ncbi:nudix/MutT family protein-like protein [Sporormia fimetaria CBS 119925]|uniref:Nudix/MutT family protein-like protein n=1 Tax=Sporormia fimetaria CBS 119925 TaxID=1340428 RepID=A0A6A6VJ13_9PLEO|nr:nudix/MutT family protein-like protein [Sporormia fimetaria CBS 119925]
MAATEQRPMKSRTGRDNQRYGPQGERLVAGVVPLSKDKQQVLLIQSTRRGGWVLPKGGWETDEATVQDAAKREAWEEAGIICTITYDLGTVAERRKPEQLTAKAPKASYHFFEATVENEEADWPEKHKRSRQWFTYKDAIKAMGDRPELLDALERCTMKR